MSGFEVAGLVLGTIPLIISALEHYKGGRNLVKGYRSHNRQKTVLVLGLRTEQCRLENTFIKLLKDLAPPSKMDDMIQSPLEGSWREPSMRSKLRARLGNYFDIFEATVLDIQNGMRDFADQLGLDVTGQGTNTSSIPSRRDRLEFAMNLSNHESLLREIVKGISRLETLTGHGVSYDYLTRKAQVRVMTLLRDLSISLHHALRQSVCGSNHNFGLELSTRSPDIDHAETEGEKLRRLKMQVALCCLTQHSMKSDAGNISASFWGKITIFALPTPQNLPTETCNNRNQSMPNRRSAKRRKIYSLRGKFQDGASHVFAWGPSSKPTDQEDEVEFDSAATPTQPETEMPSDTLDQINNLCEKIKKSKMHAGESYGFISEIGNHGSRPCKYEVFPLARDQMDGSNNWSIISLDQILRNSVDPPPMSFTDKRRIAILVSTSILQLYQTPWMSHMLSAGDIVFFKKPGLPPHDSYNQTFILNRCAATTTKNTYRPEEAEEPTYWQQDTTLFSLGLILIEILFGRIVFTREGGRLGSDLTEHYTRAQNVYNEVRLQSENYYKAVICCLEGKMRNKSGLQDEDSRHDVHERVIKPLKKEVEMLKLFQFEELFEH